MFKHLWKSLTKVLPKILAIFLAYTMTVTPVFASSTADGLDALKDRISAVFHYESGMLVSVNDANGNTSLYDSGKFRMSVSITGEVVALSLYASDKTVLATKYNNDISAFLKDAFGISEDQLKGGAEAGGTTTISAAEYDELGDKTGWTLNDDGSTYSKTFEDKDAVSVKWLGTVADWLKSGDSNSVSINFAASGGASVTLLENGKAQTTVAWDGETIENYNYVGGFLKYVDSKNYSALTAAQYDALDAADKDDYSLKVDGSGARTYVSEKWSRTVYDSKGRASAVYNLIGSGSSATLGTMTVKYNYDDDVVVNGVTTHTGTGALKSTVDLTTNVTTEIVAGKQMRSYNEASQVVTKWDYNANGTINTVMSNNNGAWSTTAYENGRALIVGSGQMSGDDLRNEYSKWVNGQGNYQLPATIQAAYLYADQLQMLKDKLGLAGAVTAYCKMMGWDATDKTKAGDSYTHADGTTDTRDSDGAYYTAYNLFTAALDDLYNCSGPAMTVSFSAPAIGKDMLNDFGLSSKASSVPNVFVSQVTLYSYGASYANYDTANLDPSEKYAGAIYAQILADAGVSLSGLNSLLGWNLSASSSREDWEAAFTKLVGSAENKEEITADEYTAGQAAVSAGTSADGVSYEYDSANGIYYKVTAGTTGILDGDVSLSTLESVFGIDLSVTSTSNSSTTSNTKAQAEAAVRETLATRVSALHTLINQCFIEGGKVDSYATSIAGYKKAINEMYFRSSDPVIQGTVVGMETIDGITYAKVAVDKVDVRNGQGLVETGEGVFMYVALPEGNSGAVTQVEEAMNNGDQVLFTGNITSDHNGLYTITMATGGYDSDTKTNVSYGDGNWTGLAVGQAAIDSYVASQKTDSNGWYSTLMNYMAGKWASVQMTGRQFTALDILEVGFKTLKAIFGIQ